MVKRIYLCYNPKWLEKIIKEKFYDEKKKRFRK